VSNENDDIRAAIKNADHLQPTSKRPQKECVACFEPIPEHATVCRYCQRHQNWWVRHFPNIGVLISLGLLLLAGLQLVQARSQAIDAEEAASTASAAAQQAEGAANATMAAHLFSLKNHSDTLGIQIIDLEGQITAQAEHSKTIERLLLSTGEHDDMAMEFHQIGAYIERDLKIRIASLEKILDSTLMQIAAMEQRMQTPSLKP